MHYVDLLFCVEQLCPGAPTQSWQMQNLRSDPVRRREARLRGTCKSKQESHPLWRVWICSSCCGRNRARFIWASCLPRGCPIQSTPLGRPRSFFPFSRLAHRTPKGLESQEQTGTEETRVRSGSRVPIDSGTSAAFLSAPSETFNYSTTEAKHEKYQPQNDNRLTHSGASFGFDAPKIVTWCSLR